MPLFLLFLLFLLPVSYATDLWGGQLAHSSIMRLNESSMSKLFDLVTMGVKYQVPYNAMVSHGPHHVKRTGSYGMHTSGK